MSLLYKAPPYTDLKMYMFFYLYVPINLNFYIYYYSWQVGKGRRDMECGLLHE